MGKKKNNALAEFVHWFRNSSPYIHAFRGRTFVIAFGGEMLSDAQFTPLVHDIALLNSLGVRLVLVHGARPQIEERLRLRGAKIRYVNDLRVTDDTALVCVKEAVGSVRVEIESVLSMGVVNSPMHGARIRVVSGNFVTAQPLGVHDGVDYCHTGQVRRIDARAVHRQLDDGAIVLLSPIAYSPTGETFNLAAEDIATAAAIALEADKLICLVDGPGVTDGRKRLRRELTLPECTKVLASKHTMHDETVRSLQSAMRACRHGVERAHLIDRNINGALLLELFTRDGVGTLITAERFEGLRQATVNDVGGVLAIIAPLEEDGTLVRRSREQLELEVSHFTVLERDGMVVACASLYPFTDEKVGELACLAVHPDYRGKKRGDLLFDFVERHAKELGLQRLFVLTTHTAHWFRERGFKPADLDALPVKRKRMYNYQRNSKVFVKSLD
ncbi:MAG: amino-acid N-acetyltransferase [Pseudomonadota bacterium]|nr:MAG: amino-acid N-acetyltransferase [Pseudomonadota bacterium]